MKTTKNKLKTKEILLTTTDDMHGYKIMESIGLVQGSIVVKTKFLTINSSNEVFTDARRIALRKMIALARQLEAGAVIGIRFSITNFMKNAVEVLAYGTAAKIRKTKK